MALPGSFPETWESSRVPSGQLADDSEYKAFAKQINRSKRDEFSIDLVHRLDTLLFVGYVTEYLYDCKLLVLVVRCGMQWILTTLRSSARLAELTSEFNVNDDKLMFLQLFIIQLGVLLIHISDDLPRPEHDGYLYGHRTLQLIGQKPLSTKWILVVMDVLLYIGQLCVFCSRKECGERLGLLGEDESEDSEIEVKKIRLFDDFDISFPRVSSG